MKTKPIISTTTTTAGNISPAPQTDSWEKHFDELSYRLKAFGYDSCPVCGLIPDLGKELIKQEIAGAVAEAKAELIKEAKNKIAERAD